MTGRSNPWTPEQLALLQQLRADDIDWPEVSQRCGHPLPSCRTTLTKLQQRQARIAAGKLPAEKASGKGHPKNPKRLWTEKDVEELIRLRTIEGKEFREIDCALGRIKGTSCAKFYSLRRPEAKAKVGGGPFEIRAIHASNRLPQHDSITAEFFGDPLPGRSALDQRRVDASGVTLATGPMR